MVYTVSSYGRKLFSIKNFSIRSYLRAPSVVLRYGSASVNANPVLFISFEPNLQYGEKRPQDNSFKVNEKNLFWVQRFFQKLFMWFSAPEYKDLFFMDETEGLMLNMDYRQLREIVRGSQYDSQIMSAVPVIANLDSKATPGVALSINRTNYTVFISDEEIGSIYWMLHNFSFQSEALLLLNIGSTRGFWEDKEIFDQCTIEPGQQIQAKSNRKQVNW